MNKTTNSKNPLTPLYQTLVPQLHALIANDTHIITVYAQTCALLFQSLSDVNWLGFYVLANEQLILGPFQGSPACTPIPLGKGVCGTCAVEQRTQLVKDVETFPGHIVCDSASRSEIVLPLVVNGQLISVLDIDSPKLARFTPADQQGLEMIMGALSEKIARFDFDAVQAIAI